MSKYYEGQFVKILNFVQDQISPISSSTDTLVASRSMTNYIGKTSRIKKVKVDGFEELYELDIDEGRWKWGDLILTRAVDIGTKVRILDLPEDFEGNNLEYSGYHKEYAGREAKVVRYDESDDTYKLDVDNENWWWEDSFVELIEENTELAPDTTNNDNNVVFALGDIVKVKTGSYAGTIGYIRKIYTNSITKKADISSVSGITFVFSNLEKVNEEDIMNAQGETVPEVIPYAQIGNSAVVVKGSRLKMPTRKTKGYSLMSSETVVKAISEGKKYMKVTSVLSSGTVETNLGTFNQQDVEVIPTNFVVGAIEAGHRIKDAEGKTHTYEPYNQVVPNNQTLIEDNNDFIEYIDSTGWFIRQWKELVTKPRGTVEYTEYFALCPEDYIAYKDQEEKRFAYLKSLVAKKVVENINNKILQNKTDYLDIKRQAEAFLVEEERRIIAERQREERERLLLEQNKYGIWKHHKDIWN